MASASALDVSSTAGRELLSAKEFPLQLRLDGLDVLCGWRPAARILVRPGREAERCVGLLLSMELALSVGRGVQWQPSRKFCGYVDWFSAPIEGEELEKFAVLYLGRDKHAASAARAADETGSDREFGLALGYPSCCVESVLRRGQVPEVAECFSLYAADGHYQPLAWPASLVLDAALTPHFPCDVACARSLEIASRRWAFIRNHADPGLVERIRWSRTIPYWLGHDGSVFAGETPPTPDGMLALACPAAPLPL